MCLRLKIWLPQKQNYNKNHEIINAISVKADVDLVNHGVLNAINNIRQKKINK